jgi:hypothetical protein
MKMIYVLVFLLVGCASKKASSPSPEKKAFEQLQTQHRPLHLACLEHRQNILEQAITEIPEAPEEDDQFFFVPNEADAGYFVENFDITKFTLKENQQEHESAINSCLSDQEVGEGTCETLIPAYKYFRGLISAMAYQPWSRQLISLGLSHTLSYLRYVGESNASLMDIILANDLLIRLAQKKLIPGSIHKEARQFKQQAEKELELLRSEVRRIEKKEMNCHDIKKFYLRERQRIYVLSEKFLKLLKKLPR